MLAEDIRTQQPKLTPEAVEKKVNAKKTSPKLIASLETKKKHICHYRLLQKYLELGMTLDGVHQVIKFRQSPWMKPYIDMNSELRKEATSEFERDFYKLMNNSVFGKTMENVRHQRTMTLMHSHEKIEWAAKQPTYRMHRNIHENLVSIERWKNTVVLDKPIYVGASVLELSKLLMLDFHYGYVKEMYPGRKSVLGFSDTDSLLYKIETDDVYRDMRDYDSISLPFYQILA